MISFCVSLLHMTRPVWDFCVTCLFEEFSRYGFIIQLMSQLCESTKAVFQDTSTHHMRESDLRFSRVRSIKGYYPSMRACMQAGRRACVHACMHACMHE